MIGLYENSAKEGSTKSLRPTFKTKITISEYYKGGKKKQVMGENNKYNHDSIPSSKSSLSVDFFAGNG